MTDFLKKDSSTGVISFVTAAAADISGVAASGANADITSMSAITGGITTPMNTADLVFNIPVTGTDSTLHTIDFRIDSLSGINISATGDGAGTIGVKTINIGVTGAADVVHIGDANALVDITDAHWSVTEAGILSIVSFGSNWTNASRTIADLGIVTTVDINGGTIDGTSIGASSASTGIFTSTSITTSSLFSDDVYAGFGSTLGSSDAILGWNTAQTVDALYLGLSAGQNTFIIAEGADKAYDFAHGAQTNPTLYIQSANQTSTEFASLNANMLTFGLGAALVNSVFSISQLNSAAQQLALNAPSGAGIVLAIDGTWELSLSASTLDVWGNSISNIGSLVGIKNNALTISIPTQGADDANGQNLTISAEDAGSGGTGNHAGGNLVLQGGTKQGSGAAGAVQFNSTWTASGQTCINLGSVTTCDINGGDIDGTTIGAASAAAGTFAALTGTDVKATARFYGQSANINSAGGLTLGTANLNIVANATTINGIVTTNWTAGSEVTLIFTGAPLVKHNTGSAGTAKIFLANSGDFQAAANSVLKLCWDGTQWQEIARKIA